MRGAFPRTLTSLNRLGPWHLEGKIINVVSMTSVRLYRSVRYPKSTQKESGKKGDEKTGVEKNAIQGGVVFH